MDVIKDAAVGFNRALRSYTLNLEMVDNELSSALYNIRQPSEKLRFLTYLKDMVETEFQKHVKVCTNPGRCTQERSYELALYAIRQQYEEYYESGIQTHLDERPAMKFFSEGKEFDAFTSIKECLKRAKRSVVLIDGYVDEQTLAFFPGGEPTASISIITKQRSVNDGLKRAVTLYNKQYEGKLSLHISEDYHDRFFILDDSEFYHVGASIKDAGKKAFMFSIIEDPEIQNVIRRKLGNLTADNRI